MHRCTTPRGRGVWFAYQILPSLRAPKKEEGICYYSLQLQQKKNMRKKTIPHDFYYFRFVSRGARTAVIVKTRLDLVPLYGGAGEAFFFSLIFWFWRTIDAVASLVFRLLPSSDPCAVRTFARRERHTLLPSPTWRRRDVLCVAHWVIAGLNIELNQVHPPERIARLVYSREPISAALALFWPQPKPAVHKTKHYLAHPTYP